METKSFAELYAELKERVKRLDPTYELKENQFSASGELVFQLVLPGVKTIEASNVKALEIVIENLEEQKRLKSRPNNPPMV